LDVPISIRHRPRVLAVLTALAALVGACSKGPKSETTLPGASGKDGPVVSLLREAVPVPSFTVTDLNGKTISSADLRGKVVFVNFWATWCPPCRAEIPDLIKLQDKYRDSVVVLGISEDEAPAESVKAFVAQQKMNYPVVMTTPELAKIFKGVVALPTTFVIDRDGNLAQRHVGLLNAGETELEAQVLTGLNTNVRVERVDDPVKAKLENAAQAKEIPGVDLTKLTPEKRTAAIQALNADDCTCGCGLTLAACRINDPECNISLPIAREVAKKFAN
jgi:cytochrome c biogenesis protein CcmG/thiol:disulfide interchange protein DsbE